MSLCAFPPVQSNVLLGLEIVSIVFVYDAPRILRQARSAINQSRATYSSRAVSTTSHRQPRAENIIGHKINPWNIDCDIDQIDLIIPQLHFHLPTSLSSYLTNRIVHRRFF